MTEEPVKWVQVSTELLAQLGEWSEPVRAKIVADTDGVLELVFERVEDPFIRLPVPNGRSADDVLTPTERAYVDGLEQLAGDRLRVVVGELLSWERFNVEVRALELDLEERRLDEE